MVMVRHSTDPDSHGRFWQLWLLMPICLCLGLSGCAQLVHPIEAIPAELIPPQFLAAPQANKRPIDVSLLRNLAPPSYILDKEDILGVFIEGILGKQDEAPPVHIPEPNSDLSPGIGFPIPVRDDGSISLPLIDPIPVRGLTVAQVEELVKRRYEDEDLLVRPRVIVTLLRKRTYRVFVVRQDNAQGNNQQLGLAQRTRGVFDRSDLSSRGYVLQLQAYENDVLNALSQTGGLPGLNAKAEVTILRGDQTQTEERFRQMQETYGANFNELGNFNPATIAGAQSTVTIPLRVAPDEIPNFRPEDVILRDGDVVYVESRDTEVYYTGGLLGGGEWPIPRDYDLDVLGAVAIAGTGVGAGGPSSRGGLIAGGNQVAPTELIVLRKLPGNRQIPIKVDLTNAINNPQSRLLVYKGDTLILRYSPEEEVINFGVSVFFTYGLRQLFRN
jgi:protein involved in polysaccharide export with SLBB domain